MENSQRCSIDEESLQYEDLIVGDERCTIAAVHDAIISTVSVGTLWTSLIDFSRELGVPSDKLILFAQRLTGGSTTHQSVLFETLEIWRSIKSSNAKLSTILKVLELQNAKDCADSLRMCFRPSANHYPCATLEHIEKSTTWNGLSSNLQAYIKEQEVMFQGKILNLVNAIGNYDITNIDGAFLVELANHRIPTFINNQVPEELKYYIPRILKSRHNLKSSIFNNSGDDIFVIQGIERTKLTSLAKQRTDDSGNQILRRRITVKFIRLERDNDFGRICKFANRPVHWIKFENDSYRWVKSSGSVKALQQHVHEIQESFIETELLPRDEKFFVISDSPGMGKTMLLANIANNFMKQNPNTIIRFLIFKKLVQELHNKTINSDSIETIIADESSSFQFGRKFMKYSINLGQCILMLDAFDEILLHQIDAAKQILKATADNPNIRHVFVTTRTHMRADVEDAISVLSYTIQPFKSMDQVSCLQKIWESEGIPSTDSTKLFAKSILHALSSNTTDAERDIAGIPLQCRLLADTYKDDAEMCSENGEEHGYQGLLASALVTSVFEMYEKHMNIRFTNGESGLHINIIKQSHMYYALQLMFPSYLDQFGACFDFTKPMLIEDLYRFGILEATQANNFQFVHRTFAEYLIAWFAIENEMDLAVGQFILFEILGTTPSIDKFELPLHDINFEYVCETSVIEFSTFNLVEICYFIDGFIKKADLTLHPIADLNFYNCCPSLYRACAFHNYLYLLVYGSNLLRIFNYIEEENYQKIPNFAHDLLLVTAQYAGEEMMQSFCEQISISELQFVSVGYVIQIDVTPLHLAIHRGHYNLVEYLMHQYDSELFNLKYLLHFCVFESLHDANEIIQCKKLIIKLLTEKSNQWLHERLNNLTPLTQYKVNLDLVECLINEGADVNARNEDEPTILRQISMNSATPKEFHHILLLLINRGFKHFHKYTSLHDALKHVDLLNETLELFHSKGADFNAEDESGTSVLFSAIKNMRSADVIQRIIQYGADLNLVNNLKQSVLHFCVLHANYEALKYFIQVQKMNINTVDAGLNTPLHYAVEQRSDEYEIMQRLLIVKAGNAHSVMSKNRMTPFLLAFNEGYGLSLEIIRLMEQNGLLINSTLAFEAMQYALCNKKIQLDSEFTNVLEHLIQKHGSVEPSVLWNPWKFERVKQKMEVIIRSTEISSDLLCKATKLGLLTTNEVVQIEKSGDVLSKKLFYNMVMENKGSFEQTCLSLLASHEISPFRLLRNQLVKAEINGSDSISQPIYVNALPGVTEINHSEEMRRMILQTSNLNLSIRRIRDTVDENPKIIREPDISADSTNQKLIVVQCRGVTDDVLKRLDVLPPTSKIICVPNQVHIDNENDQMQIFQDVYAWEDISRNCLKQLRCFIDWNEFYFTDIFATAEILSVLELDVVQYIRELGCRIIDIKVGHKTSKTESSTLSPEIFDYFLHDKLTFRGITSSELKKFAKFGQIIGNFGDEIEIIDYIVIESDQQFEELCKVTRRNVHLIEYHEGSFKLVRTYGFDSEIKKFFEIQSICENFPECICEAREDDLLIDFLLIVSQRYPVIRRRIQVPLRLMRLNSLPFYIFKQSEFKISNRQMRPVNTSSYVGEIQKIFNDILVGSKEFMELCDIAVNTLFFPELQKSVLINDNMKSYMLSETLTLRNGYLIYENESFAWYFLAKMVMEQKIDNELFNTLLKKSFDSQVFIASYFFFNGPYIVLQQSQPIESYRYTYSNTPFFNFLEHFLCKQPNVMGFKDLNLTQEQVIEWMHSCIYTNHFNLLKLITQFEIDLNSTESHHLVLLAVKFGTEPLIDLVVQLYLQETGECLEDIRLHFTSGEEFSILHVAALRGNYDVMNYLLNKLELKNMLSNSRMKNILHICVVDTFTNHNDQVAERKRIIDLLLQCNPNLISERDNTRCTSLLVPNIHVDLLIHLIKSVTDVNPHAEDKYNLLWYCPKYMNPEDYHKLVDYSREQGRFLFFPKEEFKYYFRQSIYHAVEHLEVLDSTFKLLELTDVDLNVEMLYGNTVLIQAVEKLRSARVIDALIHAGANILIRNKYNRNVIHVAAYCGNFTALNYFLIRGCNINPTDYSNFTPLHRALQNPRTYTYEILKLLLQNGADVNAVSDTLETPLSIALKRNQEGKIGNGTVELLKNAGAIQSSTAADADRNDESP